MLSLKSNSSEVKHDEEKFANLIKVIKLFYYVLSLQLNLNKSCILGINCAQDKVVSLTNSLGCEVGTWPLKYLGLPPGCNPRVTQF